MCKFLHHFRNLLNCTTSHHRTSCTRCPCGTHDDYFLFIGTDKATCAQHLGTFQSICQDIGIPLAPDKTTTPGTSTIFLGILLDSIKRLAQVPEDKIHAYLADITAHIQSGQLTQKQLRSLVGKLNFASSVVPALAFLRHLIDKVYSVKKTHQTITLSQETIQDLRTWKEFLANYNGITYFCALHLTHSSTLNMASDASKRGFGACFGKHWIQGKYPPSWQKHHITILELYPI